VLTEEGSVVLRCFTFQERSDSNARLWQTLWHSLACLQDSNIAELWKGKRELFSIS